MGKRSRARGAAKKLRADDVEYAHSEHGVLVLRGALTVPTRQQYAALGERPSDGIEDIWQRRVEFLFERLTVRWVIHDVPTERQRELLARYRMATQDERRWIREVLRTHVADHFPDVEAP